MHCQFGETHLRETVRQLLQPIAAQKTFDLVNDLAVPLPIIAIAELLGVPPERRADFKHWANAIIRAQSRIALSPEEEARIRRSIEEFRTYFQETIAAYRQQPRDNLLSDLVRAEEEEQRLTAEEVLSTALMLLIAGTETTTNLIGNVMLALFHHPEQMAQVQANPTLVPHVVEETLRYDGVVQLWPRQAIREVEIADTTVP
ncbi:MAG: cytochrome P450, partial [Candidatus Binatia bacterium]